MSTATAHKSSDAATLRDYVPGAYALRDTWIPLVHSGKVRKRPVRRAIHGEPVFVWRDRGALRATERSSEAMPGSDGGSDFTAGTGSYPLVERYGYAWVWYGDPENASPELLPLVPHIPEEGMPSWFNRTVVFDCTYELVCENLLDLTHADYLHSALTGDPLADTDDILVSSTSETVTMTRLAMGRPIPKMQKPLVKGTETQNVRIVTITHVRSGVCVLHGDFNPGMDIRMLHPCNPHSRQRCLTEVSYDPQAMPWLARMGFPLMSHVVGRQDNWALRPQNEIYLKPRPTSDVSSRFDKAALRYRKVYQQLVARQQQGDYSYLDDGDPQRDVSEELGLLGRV